MADTDIEYNLTSKAAVQGTATSEFATPANYASTSALRTRLAAINGGYYTAAKLNNMTKNDMVYAVRLNDDAGSI